MGLDLSLHGTGLALIRPSDEQPVGGGQIKLTPIGASYVETISTPSIWEDRRRRRHIAERVSAMAWAHDAQPPRTLVVIEKTVLYKDKGDTSLRLAALRAVVDEFLWRPNIDVIEISPLTVKSYAVHGRATKEEMLVAARKQLCAPHWFRYAVNHNESDAMWMCMLGRHIAGMSLPYTPTQRQTTIVNHIEWSMP